MTYDSTYAWLVYWRVLMLVCQLLQIFAWRPSTTDGFLVIYVCQPWILVMPSWSLSCSKNWHFKSSLKAWSFGWNFQWRKGFFFLCFWSSSVTMVVFLLSICVEIVKMSWYKEVYKLPVGFNLEDRSYTTVPAYSFLKVKCCSTSLLA